MIEFQRKKRLHEGLHITPLIDIIFLLLLFFLLTSVFINPGIVVELPESETAELQKEQLKLVISISKSGEIFVDNSIIPFDELPATLSNLFQRYTRENVTVKVDRNVPFELFIQVVDAVKQAGGKNLTISTEIPK
jgi:biopolymer transport protein ExbD